MAANATKTLQVRYVKSAIGYPERQKRTVRALGLKRLGDQVEMPANHSVLGMIARISHLVQVISPDASQTHTHSDALDALDAPDSDTPEDN
jgi:large subunit ribosomal protein L30